MTAKSITLPAPVVGWIRNHSVKNYWRVASWYELDDLVHDGLLKAYQCIDRYGPPGGPDCPCCGSTNIRQRVSDDSSAAAQTCRDCHAKFIDPPHFMALVKTSFHRHIAELLRSKRGVDDVTAKISDAAGEMTEADYLALIGMADSPMQDFGLMIAEMPERLRKVVEFYLNDDPKRLWRNLRVRLDGTCETLASRLKRLTDFPEDADFEMELRAYLWKRNAGLS